MEAWALYFGFNVETGHLAGSMVLDLPQTGYKALEIQQDPSLSLSDTMYGQQ